MFTTVFITFLCITCLIQPILPFYIPGVAPLDFNRGENVEVKAVKMTSTKTQLPYDYYELDIHCKPSDGIKYKSENLGEILRGDRIVTTNFKVEMDTNARCLTLCKDIKLTSEQSTKLAKRIEQNYYVHLLVDNLPCATKFQNPNTQATFYEHGYRLGNHMKQSKETYLNNHLIIRLFYHKESENGYRVVGFEVEPKSIDSKRITAEEGGKCSIQSGEGMQAINPAGENTVTMTYEVEWAPSDTRWASRWDTYLAMTDVQIHWFSLINSVIVVFFLAGILSMIIIKTLRRDIARYNKEDADDSIEETGWKLVHGDVFRPPRGKNYLAALVGSGIQILMMSFIVIVFAALGMLSPASRGALVTAACFLYVFMGLIAGYFSGRLYKTIKGSNWKRTAALTATFYPSIVCGVSLFLNFFIWGKRSSGAVPFSTMISILAMWLGISFPLVCIGFFFGYRKQPYEQPVRTNQIPKQVPEQQWFMHPVINIAIAGILPFGAMFIELFFIFSAIWENQYYYLFGFLFLVFIIIIICCSQISIVITYFQLCGEDYHWWWRSFISSGGSAFYVFGYAVFYFFTKLDITGFVPSLLYFGYTLLICFSFWVLTGTIGFYASYIFVRKIYSEVKIE
ncbi:unnamed protein product [Adineta steineri]|uniref:Transmembrane 9 superfamily member n=1 Tax=Adineta steineri TaxID=433720 RepID=A0A818KH75_9BILA|nr:unnamed protein product [Adineta steineri]CAF1178112.1 unnamed protein product [Adineta steineri]CAF3508624.1 unnamed protein product [Adineta steineri]CAF3555154.1 unnamed protein product [Adineta steineri]CAF3807687.1 unnamed protein product [Adineta steineri]